jgi:REP element-mobilizing transposase RayT
MLIQPYRLDELNFAFCYRVFYRWRTHRASPRPALARLDRATLDALLQEYGIHVLEASATETDVKVLASLVPTETVAACASKMKGRVSKWLRGQLQPASDDKLLGRGYFAAATGTTNADAVLAYLQRQGEHHGYESRPLPPVFVASYSQAMEDEQRLNAKHAATVLRLHVVLSTCMRKGVFGKAEAEAVANRWRLLQRQGQYFIEKVSFVPDHVHLAMRVHPSLAPAHAVLALMNAAQELVWKEFASSVIRARAERLWQPGAYIGSFGELESAKIAAYVRRFEAMDAERT